MSNATRRRNGALASCEPCRRGKTRCDHQKPRCGTCQRRGLEDKCWYHSAPLTKPRVRQPLASPSTSQSPATTQGGEEARRERGSHVHARPEGIDSPQNALPPPQTWPFIPENAENNNNATPQAAGYLPYGEAGLEERFNLAKELVSNLKYIDDVETNFNNVGTSPKEVIFKLFAVLKECPEYNSLLNNLRDGNEEAINAYTRCILQRASTPVRLTPNSTVEDFCLQYCGPNLRIETMGLLYSIGAQSAMHNVTHDRTKQDRFTQDMIRSSFLSLRLARDMAEHSNDIIVFLAYNNLQVATVVEGDTSLSSRRRLADLCTDLLSLGLHREETYTGSELPFFVSEHRRRLFAYSYALDKAKAIAFSRPACIPIDYVDCKPPLDLPDEILFADDQVALEEAKRNLTPDGWDSKEDQHSATWARLRYIIAHFCDKVNRYQFRDTQAKEIAELRELSESCHTTWNALPPHLRYCKECWSSLSPGVCFMLAKLHLAYISVDFLIYQMIGTKNGNIDPCLVQVSMTTLETMVQIVNARDRFGYSPRDLPSLLLSFGLPAAVILTTILQDAANDPSRWIYPSVKRSLILRNLSILVLHMETVPDVSERNHAFCLQAAKAISEKLDRLLDGPSENTPTPLPMYSSAENVNIAPQPTSDIPDAANRFLNLDNFDINSLDFGMWQGAGDFGSFINQWDLF